MSKSNCGSSIDNITYLASYTNNTNSNSKISIQLFQAKVGHECVGAIVCKLDYHKKVVKRGYIAMLAVDSKYRKLKIGSTLVRKAIETMIAEEADEVILFIVVQRCGKCSVFKGILV